jgi:hypothetical protein
VEGAAAASREAAAAPLAPPCFLLAGLPPLWVGLPPPEGALRSCCCIALLTLVTLAWLRAASVCGAMLHSFQPACMRAAGAAPPSTLLPATPRSLMKLLNNGLHHSMRRFQLQRLYLQHLYCKWRRSNRRAWQPSDGKVNVDLSFSALGWRSLQVAAMTAACRRSSLRWALPLIKACDHTMHGPLMSHGYVISAVC